MHEYGRETGRMKVLLDHFVSLMLYFIYNLDIYIYIYMCTSNLNFIKLGVRNAKNTVT